jgi:hypothetical protein
MEIWKCPLSEWSAWLSILYCLGKLLGDGHCHVEVASVIWPRDTCVWQRCLSWRAHIASLQQQLDDQSGPVRSWTHAISFSQACDWGNHHTKQAQWYPFPQAPNADTCNMKLRNLLPADVAIIRNTFLWSRTACPLWSSGWIGPSPAPG